MNCLLKTIKVDNDKERQNKRFYTVFCKCLQLLYLESHNCCFVFQMPVLYTVTLIAPVYSKHHRMAIVPSPEILWKKVTIVVCHWLPFYKHIFLMNTAWEAINISGLLHCNVIFLLYSNGISKGLQQTTCRYWKWGIKHSSRKFLNIHVFT